MHESDTPDPVAPDTTAVDGPVEDTADRDGVLDGFATDLDNVAAALDALDADDLDTAEALVAGLETADTDTEPA
ncbi:MAG: hypothetical protein R2707_16250 [Acidimicrobiales bacterium]